MTLTVGDVVRGTGRALGAIPGPWPEFLAGARLVPWTGAGAAWLGTRYGLAPLMGLLDRSTSDQDKRRMANRAALLTLLGTSAVLYPPLVAQRGWKSLLPGYKQSSLIPTVEGSATILSDPVMDPWQKARALNVLYDASGGQPIVTIPQLVRASVGAGLGAAFGRTMGTLLGLPDTSRRRLTQAGAIGALLGTLGIIGGG